MKKYFQETDLLGWLDRAGLDACSAEEARAALASAQAAFEAGRAQASGRLTAEGAEAFLRYRVPLVTADGSCSLPDVLAPEPFDLGAALGGAGVAVELACWRGFLEALNQELRADWLGLYLRREGAGGPVLLKVAYLGAPSRAEFPLTEAFAARSNNTLVGLSGRAVRIDDVAERVAGGGPYYACDGRVRSELCVPLFGCDGGVAGILDAEAFQPGHFTAPRQRLLAAAACVAGRECRLP